MPVSTAPAMQGARGPTGSKQVTRKYFFHRQTVLCFKDVLYSFALFEVKRSHLAEVAESR